MTLVTRIEQTGSRFSGANSGIPRVEYPFAAVVGFHTAKRALMLLAVDPGLRGALIASSGSDESLLARAFAAVIDYESNGVIDLPLNITEDRLLGELDLERTIATGKRDVSIGLLARANGRVLVANEINLLDSGIAAQVAQCLDSRRLRVEREGIGATQEADFILIGTFNPSDGEPGRLLSDRVGLIVNSTVDWPPRDKAEIIERAFRFEHDPLSFAEDFAFETAQLRCQIEDARSRLRRVRISKAQLRRISQIAVRLGVEGNRADVFALKAARASAALAARDAVGEDDLVAAIQLVLVPRATTLPLPREEANQPTDSSNPERTEERVEDSDSDSIPGLMEDLIIQASDALLPRDLISSAAQANRTARAGKRFKPSPSARGRYVRSVIKRSRDARIAIDATLRAAAPYQVLRRARNVPWKQNRRVRIEPTDLRFKELKHRSGILFILAVDASGSMALNRMAQAKGALTRLLQQAYLHRDKVALISFRGANSEVLLAPTRSIELARRLVNAIPAGGGTPVAAGITKAIELARLARLRGSPQAMLVLFTDGRANVGLDERRPRGFKPSIGEELNQLGAVLMSECMQTVVVDTKSKFVSNGEGMTLARRLGARYVYLPRSEASAVYNAISSITGRTSEN